MVPPGSVGMSLNTFRRTRGVVLDRAGADLQLRKGPAHRLDDVRKVAVNEYSWHCEA